MNPHTWHSFTPMGLLLAASILAPAAFGASDDEASALAGSPKLRLLAASIDDSTGGGNNNSILEPGESFALVVALDNLGNLQATGVFGELRLARPLPGVAILDKTALWTDIPVDGPPAYSDPPHFEIAVPASAACGSVLPLVLDVTADGGYAVSIPFDLPIRQYEEQDLRDAVHRAAVFGTDPNDGFGASPAFGDINGDGMADFLAGAPLADGVSNLKNQSGEVFLHYGSPGPFVDVDLASPPAGVVRILGAQPLDRLGTAVASGDVNGDGYDDIVIGAPFGEGGGGFPADTGVAHVVYGQPGPLASPIDLQPPVFMVPYTLMAGASPGDRAGRRVATGDMNGDGFADVAVAAPDAAGLAGEVYVVFGRAGDLGTPIVLGSSPGGYVHGDLVHLGDALAMADVDGDGLDDLIASAPGATGPGNRQDAGSVFVIYGSTTALGNLDLSTAPAGVTRIDGSGVPSPPGSFLGEEIAAGDLDGDGFQDLVISAHSNGPGQTRLNAGSVWVVYGSSSRPAEIDLRSPPPGAFAIHGADAEDRLGSMVAAGDLDGDGLDELILGSETAAGPGNARGSNTGEVYVLYGTPVRRTDVDLADPPPDAVVTFGADAGDFFGSGSFNLSVLDGAAAVGDRDGDGFGDLAVGASFADGAGNGRGNSGEASFFAGGPRRMYDLLPEPFAFIDTSAGTPLALGDDDTVRIPIGFPFDHFGERFTDLTVAANGYVSFLDQGFSLNNRCGPNRSLPNHVVAAFWDDLDPSSGGAVRYLLQGTAPSRRLTVEWAGVPYFGGAGGGVTFQITLFEGTDQIVVQYLDVAFGSSHDAGATAVAGVENRTGLIGTSLSCFSPALSDGTAFRYVPFARPHTIFMDRMESGTGGWTATGLWHQVTEPTCGDSARSPSHSWYYGQDSVCTFDTGSTNSGTLDSPAITGLLDTAALEFWSRRVTEPFPGFPVDVTSVEVTSDGGMSFTPLIELLDVSGTWQKEEGIDLGAWAGEDISVRYSFDTIDPIANAFLGWQVDDVRIRGCRRFGVSGSAISVAYASASPVCQGDAAVVDGVGSFCSSCAGGLTYAWREDGVPIPGASAPSYTVAGGHAAGTFDFSLEVACATDPACTAVSDPATLSIVPPPPPVGPTLRVAGSTIASPSHLAFTWTDVAGADDYVVVQDALASGSFTTIAGAAASGIPGLTVPTPPGSIVYFRVAGRSAVCGTGPLE